MNRNPKTVDLHVGARIRLRRRQLHMSQSDLSAALGLTFQQVQKYERGTNRVSASKLYDVAMTLGVGVSWFFEGLDETADPKAPPEHSFHALVGCSYGPELAELFPELDAEARSAVIATVRALARIVVHDRLPEARAAAEPKAA